MSRPTKRSLTIKKFGAMILILLVGAFFRFTGINWDQNAHLHPDERFLVMVQDAMRLPSSLADYLSPQRSTFNPGNVGYEFFVYGTLPLTLNKLVAIPLGNDSYGGLTLQGRVLSGIADLFTLAFVFLIGKWLTKRYRWHDITAYLGALLYAVAVLPIQLSHFFATDSFLVLFMTLGIYATLKYSESFLVRWVFAMGIFWGAAVATKVSAIYGLPLVAGILCVSLLTQKRKAWNKRWYILLGGLVCVVVGYVSVRGFDPYLFADTNWLHMQPNPTFISNLKSLKQFDNPEGWFPPAVQWIHKPAVIFSMVNMAMFGLGLPYFGLVLVGMGVLFWLSFKKRKWVGLVILGWLVGFFLYQSTQFVKALRYFSFLYPWLSILAAIGWYWVGTVLKRSWRVVMIGIVGLLVVVWPLMFLSIYLHRHTRVAASYWMYDHIPQNSVVLFEHWDDGLPVVASKTQPKTFKGEQLPIFGADDDHKWQVMDSLLAQGDYYILTSNRGWGSIPTVPERYPRMTQFYKDLFAGKTNYQLVAEFASYPSLQYLGVPLTIPDDWADETFTVYDHPKVMIFQKQS